ncbi:hypothetical protein ACQ856_29040 (plasmid) [Mycolicibacterium psychrotolerans]|uniref:hypothetical protein n=1 Tax=Mycolicibacterium psychrotolerans TaxID=216929 RepID=UPI003D6665EF
MKVDQWRRISAATVCAMTLAACHSNAVSGQPVSTPTTVQAQAQALEQPGLLEGFRAAPDPMAVFRAGFYNLLRQPMGQSVAIVGYRHTIASDGTTAKTTAFAFNPMTTGWEPLIDDEIVWSPSQHAWATTDLTETITPGPAGSRGWPTVKSTGVEGTSYDTLSVEDLAGRALSDGLEKGFAQGGPLPASATGATFSPGAQAFVRTTTTVDPTYTVRHIADANTNGSSVVPVYACGTPTPQCTTVAASLDVAAKQGGQFTNFAKTARLELRADGTATLRPVDVDIPFATLTYRIVDNNGPRRMVFEAANSGDADKFTQAIDAVNTFALYEYNGQVVVGMAQPANTTSTYFAGYNQVAANDLVTHWTPALTPVKP